MTKHVHITENDKLLGTVHVDERGEAKGDTPTAEYFIERLEKKGHHRSDPDVLDRMVQLLDRSTMIAARHCSEDHAHHAKEERHSTDPSEVNDPEDAWPEWGEQTNDQKTREIQFGDSSTRTV